MDDGRRELVEVAQPEGHFQHDTTADLSGEGTVCVQTAAEGSGQVLHHQLGQLRVCFHTHTQELDYVGMVELSKQLTLCSKPVTNKQLNKAYSLHRVHSAKSTAIRRVKPALYCGRDLEVKYRP